MRAFELRHIVGLEETNLVGNVYYANHVRWQGRCREMFLRDHAPSILDGLNNDLALLTMNVSCEYLAELSAFDELVIRMTLGGLKQNQIKLLFEYWKCTLNGEQLVARGEQQVACMKRIDDRLQPAPIPNIVPKPLGPQRTRN